MMNRRIGAIGILLMLLTGILNQSIPTVEGEEVESGLLSNPIPLHLNLKESAKFSPETRSDVEYIASEEKYSSHEQNTPPPVSTRNKGEFKSMGVWESDPVGHEITISDVMFSLWWVEDPDDEDYAANLELRWTVFLDGEQIFQYEDNEDDHDGDDYADGTGPCDQTRDDPCEYAESPTNDFPETVVQRGQTLSLEAEMKAFQAIYIYYDNMSRDSGMMIQANAVSFGKSNIRSDTVGFEFVEAWGTNVQEAIDGNFLTIIVDNIELDNSQQTSGYPKIGKGNTYSFNGTDVDSVTITWKIEDEYAKIDQTIISFSYARKASTTTPPISLNIGDLPQSSAGNSGGGGLLKETLPGFEILAVLLTFVVVALKRREL
jgi:hypothetical protein